MKLKKMVKDYLKHNLKSEKEIELILHNDRERLLKERDMLLEIKRIINSDEFDESIEANFSELLMMFSPETLLNRVRKCVDKDKAH